MAIAHSSFRFPSHFTIVYAIFSAAPDTSKIRPIMTPNPMKDQFEVAEDLKLIYRAPNKEMAIQMFQQFESKWSSKYPREVQSWANELDVLLTCMDDPSSIRSVIY